MSSDPHAALRETVLRTVFDGPGESTPALRNAAAEGAGLPADVASLVDKIHRHAYQVTDEDVARVQGTYGDDKLFEVIVGASLGASLRRLRAGLAALDDA